MHVHVLVMSDIMLVDPPLQNGLSREDLHFQRWMLNSLLVSNSACRSFCTVKLKHLTVETRRTFSWTGSGLQGQSVFTGPSNMNGIHQNPITSIHLHRGINMLTRCETVSCFVLKKLNRKPGVFLRNTCCSQWFWKIPLFVMCYFSAVAVLLPAEGCKVCLSGLLHRKCESLYRSIVSCYSPPPLHPRSCHRGVPNEGFKPQLLTTKLESWWKSHQWGRFYCFPGLLSSMRSF